LLDNLFIAQYIEYILEIMSIYFISSNHQKVLSFFAKFSDEEFYEREIACKIGISFGSANQVLNELFSDGLLNRQKKGKMFFYSFNSADPIFRQFKIFNTIVLLRPLLYKLMNTSQKIILYGSCADGTDSSQSDIDIFIVSNYKKRVIQLIEKYSLGTGFEKVKIQPMVFSPLELLKSEKSEKEFLSLVNEGLVLWEKASDESQV